MAWAVNHPGRTRWRHSTGQTVAERRVTVRPIGASVAGVAAVVVGAWGALAGYLGPYFGWHPTAGTAWDANLQNGLLHLAPGAAAVVAGIMMLAMSPARRGSRGGALLMPALLLMAAGAWFVIGPVAWPTFESGPAFSPALDAGRNLLNQACSSLAPGLVLAALGGMGLKAATARPVVTEQVAEPLAGPAGGPVTESEPAVRP